MNGEKMSESMESEGKKSLRLDGKEEKKNQRCRRIKKGMQKECKKCKKASKSCELEDQ